MGMVVRSNIMALNANRQLGMNNSQVSKSLEKLSSGYRINRAGDDASGLAISEKMKAQIKGLETASANSQDGISLVQTAEGALTEVHDMLNRMVELCGKAANGTIDSEVDRASLQKEMNSLIDEINRIAEGTNFNGISLLDGSLGGAAAKAPTVDVAGITSGTATVKDAAAVAYKFTAGTQITTAHTDLKIDYTDADGKAQSVTVKFAAGGSETLTAQAAVAELKKDAAFSSLFNISEDGTGKFIFEAKDAGATKASITAVGSGTGNTSTDLKGTPTTVDGAAAGKEITLGANMTAGDKITINGKTYTMAGAKNEDKLEFSTFDELKALLAKDNIALTGSANNLNNGTKLTVRAVPAADAAGKGLTLQIGDTAADYNQVTVQVGDMSAAGLGIADLKVDTTATAGGIMTQEDAQLALDKIKTGANSAINLVSAARADLGALQNRLEHTINNLDVATENMESANSRIRDTDMAKEMMEYTKQNVLTQAAQAMLAQANQQPQGVLQLLQ